MKPVIMKTSPGRILKKLIMCGEKTTGIFGLTGSYCSGVPKKKPRWNKSDCFTHCRQAGIFGLKF